MHPQFPLTETERRMTPTWTGIPIVEVKAAGFELVGSSDLLRNPNDARTLKVFDPAIRGKTDQFVLKFRKPTAG